MRPIVCKSLKSNTLNTLELFEKKKKIKNYYSAEAVSEAMAILLVLIPVLEIFSKIALSRSL